VESTGHKERSWNHHAKRNLKLAYFISQVGVVTPDMFGASELQWFAGEPTGLCIFRIDLENRPYPLAYNR
jgi:hypothetical protein